MRIKNYMEDVVFMMIDDVLRSISFECCPKCVMDIAAIALNELPSEYVVTDVGEVYMKVKNLQSQFEADVIAAITKAAEKVKKNPRH